MNAELSAAAQQRAMVTTAHRDSCLAALRALSHNKNSTPLLRLLDKAQQFSAEGDWSSDEAATRTLDAINAFSDSVAGGGLGDAVLDRLYGTR
jgi:hypothetical protein